jgi:hypothetical protein
MRTGTGTWDIDLSCTRIAHFSILYFVLKQSKELSNILMKSISLALELQTFIIINEAVSIPTQYEDLEKITN